jgi:hypothetical protein
LTPHKGIEREEREKERDGERGCRGDGAEPGAGAAGRGRRTCRCDRQRLKSIPEEPIDETSGENSEEEIAPFRDWARGRGFGLGFGLSLLQAVAQFSRFRNTPGYGKNGKPLKQLDGNERRDGGTGGGEKRGADDGRRIRRVRRRQNPHGSGRDELDAAGIDGEEGTHRIGGGAGVGIEALEALHRLEAEWGGGVAEAEHVGGHVHDHGAHGGIFRRDVGEEESQQGAQPAGDDLDEAGFLREAHDAEPEGHVTDEGKGGADDGGLGGVEGAIGERLEIARGSADQYRREEEGEPDVVQHRARST